ncbi:DNA primase [Streptomyces sp. TRM70350]|uniref:DNA primase n=1 Tax=Streptomyces sp. TRM70350 TaxID=2856165 RepID=UPI001C4566E1|nr:DNA primase [Streptomyces sp. TRM70350]MBV7694175.1 DNA primase [Streptomyces sp. TRM70350]
MNRVGLGLAVGAGYVLGRTRKLKLAFAVGTLVAGKRMNPGPRALADLVSGQLRNNPQFKELGDQLRQDLRGVGGAATGALLERRLDALADRLHDRTAGLRERLGAAAPEGRDPGYDDEEPEAEERYGEEPDDADEPAAEGPQEAARKKADPKELPAKKAETKKATAKKAPAKKAAKKTPARKAAPAKKAAAKRTAARKTASAKTAAAVRSREGGGER